MQTSKYYYIIKLYKYMKSWNHCLQWFLPRLLLIIAHQQYYNKKLSWCCWQMLMSRILSTIHRKISLLFMKLLFSHFNYKQNGSEVSTGMKWTINSSLCTHMYMTPSLEKNGGIQNVDNIYNPLHLGMLKSIKKWHSFIHTTQVTPQQRTEK